MTLSDSLHRNKTLKKGEFFIKEGAPCKHIGQVISGVLRGFVFDSNGDEITTHFYQEGDVIIGTYLPNVSVSMNIEALEECIISIANYNDVMSHVNRDKDITEVVNRVFQKYTTHQQERLVSLLNLNSVSKYEMFLNNYPSLINRIPHYYIANYLGITPTQLSRARKAFINKCK
ncbi:MAG: Crp/Fnr family transcriptional regulator [Bacteroidales bacterium]|nr:Crp/Fnr family transcriptional regulator [Bacteroidales bacterium]